MSCFVVFDRTETFTHLLCFVDPLCWCFRVVLLGFYRAVGRVAVVDLDAHLATGTADILCRTLDPAFLYASIAVTGEGGHRGPTCSSTIALLLVKVSTTKYRRACLDVPSEVHYKSNREGKKQKTNKYILAYIYIYVSSLTSPHVWLAWSACRLSWNLIYVCTSMYSI